MKKFASIQIVAIILFAGALSGLTLTTDVYETVENVIVRVKCLSCMKLDPKTELDFQFDTSTGEPHPSFVVDHLNEGPVFLAFRADVCAACDIMEPIVMEIFDVEFGIKETFIQKVPFGDVDITFYHINIDHAENIYREAFNLYDKDYVQGVPMFVMITYGYDHGFVKPAYATTYGTLNLDNDPERKELLENIITNGIDLYKENEAGQP